MIQIDKLRESDRISTSFENRRRDGGCSLWRMWGIPMQVRTGRFNDLYKWEKEYFLNGIKLRKWDKEGNLLEPITENTINAESEFMDKVKEKLQQHKVNDFVDDLENPPIQQLNIEIPSNPFDEMDDGDDDYANSELTLKQNNKFRRFLDAKGFDDFDKWWKEEGKDRTNDLYTEAMIHNEPNGDVIEWWNKWFNQNIEWISDKFLSDMIWSEVPYFKK